LTTTAVPSHAVPGPPLPSIHRDHSTIIKFVASSASLGSWPCNRPHLAAHTAAQSLNLKSPLRWVHKTRVACVVGKPRNQGISFQFIALLASPPAVYHPAHHGRGSTTVEHSLMRPCHCRVSPHLLGARGQFSSSHLRTNHHIVGFLDESLELTSYLFCPGLADVHQNGTAVTAGPPPLWSNYAIAARLALSSPSTSRSLLGKGWLSCWGGEGLLWSA